MKITTAWVWCDTDDAPELVSAYDELTEDTWGKTPDFFNEDIAKHDGEVRIVVIDVDSSAIYDLFKAPTIAGTVDT